MSLRTWPPFAPDSTNYAVTNAALSRTKGMDSLSKLTSLYTDIYVFAYFHLVILTVGYIG